LNSVKIFTKFGEKTLFFVHVVLHFDFDLYLYCIAILGRFVISRIHRGISEYIHQPFNKHFPILHAIILIG